MLGRPHVACSPDDKGDQGRDECYGKGNPDLSSNVMGTGGKVSSDDMAPFLAGMRATTGCEWKATGGGLSGLAIFGIVAGAVGVVAGGITIGVLAGMSHKK